jgi:mRNA interferase RelE/StbE
VAYTVEIKKSAEREMNRLPEAVHQRVSQRILALGSDPRPPNCRKLEGGEGYRLRVGDYRVLYTIDDHQRRILIFSVAHRREAYR